MSRYDYLVVGAGLFGSTFAYLAHKRGKKCLVIDKRPHAGGNIYCEEIEGINVHMYGPHIFHTSDKEVWNFVNSIVPFNGFINCPLAQAPNGRLYNLPFNMNTFYQMWGAKNPVEALAKLDEQRNQAEENLKAVGVSEPRNLEEQALCLVGRDIYEQLIKGYTEKQWGRPCNELPAFIVRRLPVRMTFDNNYFNDPYQGIPTGGYNKFIDGLLDGIQVKLNTDFFADRSYWESVADKIIYTGKIDEFYDYQFGRLTYRSSRFETEIVDEPNYQGNAVVNYTSPNIPYTRIIEHKHFEAFGAGVYTNPHTVISREYPSEWKEGMEPLYPLNDKRNQFIFAKYNALAQREENVIFGGRLAEYKYYDMAPVIMRAREIILRHGRR